MHRHGSYARYAQPTGEEQFVVQRFLCPPCGHTVSVLPGNRVTYRPLEVKQIEAHFDAQAEVSSGLDPPPGPVMAGCLQRAWNRFLTRVTVLANAFGQMLPAVIRSPPPLWEQLRRAVGAAEQMLRFLARYGKRSLLGDYRCLKPAP